MTGVPTQGEAFAKLLEHLRLAQEDSAMLAHLHQANDKHSGKALSWLAVSELLKKMVHQVTELAKRGMQ